MAKLRLSIAIVAAVIAAGCSSEKEGEDASEPYVRIVAPEAGDTLAGAAEMKMELALPGEVDRVELGINGEWIELDGASSSIPFDTLGAEDGALTLGYRVTAADGSVYEDSVEVEIDNPEHRLQSYEPDSGLYSNGDTVTVALMYTEPGLELTVDGSEVDSAFNAGAVDVQDLGEGAYQISYPISEKNTTEDGYHVFIVRAENAAGEAVENYVEIDLRKKPSIPFTVAGGSFIDRGEPPVVLVSEGAPKLASVESNPTLVTGGSLDMKLTWEEDLDNPARAIIVASEDNSGYWTIPVDSTNGQQTLELSLYDLSPALDGTTNNVMVAVVDNAGQAIEWRTYPINQLVVGSGGVQVSLTWDRPMDLDLHVTDPNDNVIDFATIGTGDGLLDLDSNAECVIDNKNTENVFWADGAEVPGTYKIHVSPYAACGQSGAHYKVAAQVCGRAYTFEGDFTAAEAIDDPDSLGREVGQIVMNCPQKVSGKISFERRNVIEVRGVKVPQASAGTRPARFAPVQVIRTADNACLARTVTDKDGKYTLRFQNTGDPKFKVQAEARSGRLQPATETNPCPEFETLASVMMLDNDAVYNVISAEQDGSANPTISGLNLKASMTKVGGAFNINDVVAQGYNWVRAQLLEELPAVKARWTRDQDPPSPGGSYFKKSESTFYMGGRTANPAEWDDVVIGHELSHFIARTLSKIDSPGGPHDPQSIPTFAWSEGLATALSADILGRRVYADTVVNSGLVVCGLCRDLEGDTKIQAGTDDGDMDGRLDEFLVSTILYDLLDGANESHDKVKASYYHVLGSAFTYVKNGKDRGDTGVDLVDFLDGWRCQDQKFLEIEGTSYESDLQTLLKDASVDFPYDFETLTCPSPD